MTLSILDYHSPTPTFALAFSPLSNSTQSLKLAVGSFNDGRSDLNNVTVVGLDPAYLDLEDDYDDAERNDGTGGAGGDSYARGRDGSYVKTGSAFVPLAKAPHPYPPSAVAFSPARLSSSLQSSSSGTQGEVTREMLASSSDCLRLWDLVGDDGSPLSGNGFVGSGRGAGGSRLVQRAVLANVRLVLVQSHSYSH